MSSQFLAILFALAAAAAWGSGDFGGGMASRRRDALRVVIVSQVLGTIAVLAVALITRESLPQTGTVLAALVAGASGGIGLMMLYEALAIGPMGVVAPLTAAIVGIVPATVGILTDGWPGAVRFAGFVLALFAAWIIAAPGDHHAPSRRAILLSLAAGACFAVFLTVIARVSDDGVYWPLVSSRVASVSILGMVFIARLLRSRRAAEPVAPVATGAFPWFFVALAGLGDTIGNVFYVLSAQFGRLDVAAVIASLYPAATVLLARVFLDERLARRQTAGVVLALVAIGLIAL